MSLSIIIISYNTKALLKNCLESIFKNKLLIDLEVIVIDNNYNDGSSMFIKNNFPQIRLINNKENIGFARACNQGAKLAQGEILFFLNPDTLIKQNIFPKIINTFKEDALVGIIAPQLILPDGSAQPWAAGKDWVSGGALVIRTMVFKKINGFDEQFFMYFEDKDICWRVRRLGYKVMILPDLKVIHLGGKSLDSKKARKEIYYQSQNYFWQKQYGLLIAWLLCLIRWPYKRWIFIFKK